MDQVHLFASFAKKTAPEILLSLLSQTIEGLSNQLGTWKIPWGEINRYQRSTGSIYPKFDDAETSLPVGMASSLFGSLPAFETSWSGTKKGYGYAGNSFVAVVEFGPRIKAKSIVTGGQSFQPGTKNFSDQAEMYINGKFKNVLFHKEDVLKGAERSYRPGD